MGKQYEIRKKKQKKNIHCAWNKPNLKEQPKTLKIYIKIFEAI